MVITDIDSSKAFDLDCTPQAVLENDEPSLDTYKWIFLTCVPVFWIMSSIFPGFKNVWKSSMAENYLPAGLFLCC